MLNIAYLVHDLGDPAVRKRVGMFAAGGASVSLFGFRRRHLPIGEVAGAPAVNLGRTIDLKLSHRVAMVAWAALTAPRWARTIASVDVICARNLEMLALAAVARMLSRARAALVYECLDVHRLMVSPGVGGRLLRGLERGLMRRCSLLIVSSPAFLEAHFAGQSTTPPTLLVENKVLELGEPERVVERRHAPPDAPPWRIGWFGMIRCSRSLQLLRDLVIARPGEVEVLIRGRPTYDAFDGFDRLVTDLPGLRYDGEYAPDELDELYGQVHFTWAIDYFEEGCNSAWLLPNRLYEGGSRGSVAIALRDTETGRWLLKRGSGVLLHDPLPELLELFDTLDEDGYSLMRGAAQSVPKSDLVADRADCRELVTRLAAAGDRP